MKRPATGILPGDRAIYEGIGQRRGKFCDVTHLRGRFASVTFRKDGARILVPAARLTAVPARHDGDF